MSGAIQMIKDYAKAYGVREDEGQGMVEYALVVGTVSLVLIAAFVTTGITGGLTSLADGIGSALSGATT